MKAFLLAAGNGTRLRPLTEVTPKCLVPIRGRPLLEIWLDLCLRSGIMEVLINVHAHAVAIEQFLRQYNSPVNVQVVHEAELLGSAGTVASNRAWLGTDSVFLILYADILTNMNLKRMVEFHSEHESLATLGLYRVADPSSCGVAITDGRGVITDFEEKPLMPRSNRAFSGIMIANRGFLDRIPPFVPADIGFHVLPGLRGEMMAYPVDDYLLDIGTMSNYAIAQTTWPADCGYNRSVSQMQASHCSVARRVPDPKISRSRGGQSE
jgi:mannose-1-phosphate guanylyltransferase